MKTTLYVSLFVILLTSMSVSQEFGIKFNGFVKSDFFYDSRQTVSIREGHFLLYPAVTSLDSEKNDLNDRGSFNYLSIQTRLSGTIAAPDAFSAKTSGVLEADFFGNENANFVDANGFRLRHAFAKLSWPNTELLVGQYWHPFFVPTCFSEVISFNTGAPMQPFSRNPQVRLTQKVGSLRLIAAVVAQRDFTSAGGSAPLRNSMLPDFNAQIHASKAMDEGKGEFLVGAGGSYKTLLPVLQTKKGDKKFKSEETIAGVSGTVFMKYKRPKGSLKVQGTYGRNLFDLTMLGGYAVSSVIDTVRNSVKFTTVNCYSVWSECILQPSPRVQYGLWVGYTENLGSQDSVLIYSNQVGGTDATVRGASANNTSDLKSVFRLSPRVVLTSGNLAFAVEAEYTIAAYAKADSTGILFRDYNGKITETESVDNIRLLFSTILRF